MEEICNLGERFDRFCEQFRPAMRTQTHDTSEYGVRYVSGLLRLEGKRTIVNISRQTGVKSQTRQQFISDSPWSGAELIKAVQADIKEHAIWQQGAVPVVDESASEKAGKAVQVRVGSIMDGWARWTCAR